MSNPYTYGDYLNDDCTLDEFKSTLNLTKLELNKVYKQLSSSWAEKHYKIIYQDDHISLGICIFNAISNKFIGDYELFNTKDGFRYSDTRYNYRLLEKVIK